MGLGILYNKGLEITYNAIIKVAIATAQILQIASCGNASQPILFQ